MIKQEAIVHTERIRRLGDQRYFQINLPEDTDKITGIELSAFRTSSDGTSGSGVLLLRRYAPEPTHDPLFTIDKNVIIGRLTLQSLSKAGIFFQDEVRQKDANWKWADYAALYPSFDQWTHTAKRHEVEVAVAPCTPVIEGYYKDSWGVQSGYNIEYELNIYIWIEKNGKQ